MNTPIPRTSLALACVAILLGFLNELGWWANISLFRTLIPKSPPMSPITALGLILLGGVLVSIVCLRDVYQWNDATLRTPSKSAHSPLLRMFQSLLLVCAAIVFLFGLTQFFLFFWGLPYKIDQWLFYQQMFQAAKGGTTSKVATNTALGLACLAGGLLSVMLLPRKVYVAQIFAFITIVLCVFAILVLPVSLFVDPRLVYASSMSLPTILGLSLLGLGIFNLAPKEGIFRMRAEYRENKVRLPIWVKMGLATCGILLLLTLQAAQTVIQINQLQRDNLAAQAEMRMLGMVERVVLLTSSGSPSTLHKSDITTFLRTSDSALMVYRKTASEEEVRRLAAILDVAKQLSNAAEISNATNAKATERSERADSLYAATRMWFHAKWEHPEQTFLNQYIQDSQNLSRFIVINVSGTIVIMLVVMGLTAFNISEALLQVMRGTKSIALGNFDTTIPINARDETAVVAHSFNDMAQQLSQMTGELHQQIEIQTEQAQFIELANTQLQEQNEELNSLNMEKNEIMGIVAHDLKNPIGAVRGLAELIQMNLVDAEQQGEILHQIIATSERMLELVTNLLDVNRLESQGMQFQAVTFDIAPVVESTVWQYKQQAEAKNITLHFENIVFADGASNLVLADEQAIMQVLDNVISNAVKYSPLGKNVFVRVKSSTEAVRVEVQDEGPGISEEDMTKLFGKFARLSARPTGGEHSTGLGLSIVKKMVEAMNGKVWCESELGKGATFIVELQLH